MEICYDVFISNCEGSVTLGGYVDSPNIIWTPYAPQSASPHNIANISTLNIEKYSVGGNKLEYSRIAAITPAFRSMQMPSNEYAITFQLFAYICNEGIIAPCQIDHPDYSLFPIMEIVIDGGGHLYLNPQDYLIIVYIYIYIIIFLDSKFQREIYSILLFNRRRKLGLRPSIDQEILYCI